VTAIPDRRPEVRLLAPTSRDALSPNALLPLKILATDNYGVESVDLVWRVGLGGEEQIRPVGNATPGREVVAFDPIEVAAFRGPDGASLREGDLLQLRVVARDNNGLEDRTPEPVRLEIATPDEVERRLGQRQVALREDAAGAQLVQRDARAAVALLLGDVKPGDPLDRAAVDRLRDGQILQGRVTRKVDEFLGGIRRVLNGYVFNRLGGNPVAGEAMLRIYLDHLERDRIDLSRVYKPELYADIVAAYRNGEIFDPEILGILVEIIEVATRLSSELSPRAHQLVSGLVRGEVADPAATLKSIDEVQGACLAEFAKLMDMMKRWETYHEFVLRMRDIEEAQEEIIDRARKSADEDGGRGR
jgi:hypothetical protein